jgi:hypothetical protein
LRFFDILRSALDQPTRCLPFERANRKDYRETQEQYVLGSAHSASLGQTPRL